MLTRDPAAPARAAGFTIIEFMIAMTLSLLVLAALTAAFVANSRSRTEIERANEQIENGRFALQILTDDLETAGFLSHFNPLNAPSLFPAPGGAAPNPCNVAVADLQASFLIHIQGYDDLDSDLEDDGLAEPDLKDDCDFLDDFRKGTDIVVVRRTATCTVGSANCAPPSGDAPYFQASLCETELDPLTPLQHFKLVYASYGNPPADPPVTPASLDRRPRSCTAGQKASVRQFLTHIYFVANKDLDGTDIPTLMRAELGVGGYTVVPLARGIEDLQVEYGVDSLPALLRDGSPDAFIGNPATVGDWLDVMAVRLYVLARNSTPSPDHTDTKKYVLAQNAPQEFGDGYKRHVYQTTVRLNNAAGRRE